MTNLRWRNEWKYWISWSQYLELRTRLRVVTAPDAHAGSTGEYMVRSLYFDTRDDEHAFEKLAGLSRRAKYRVRIYDSAQDWGRLEVKHRSGHRVAKENTKLSRDMIRGLLGGATSDDWGASRSLRTLRMALHRRIAKPSCIVQYTREPYIFGPGNVRITFDKHLKTGAWGHDLFHKSPPLLPVSVPGDLILEVKFDGFLPSVIQRLFPRTISGPSAISKYMLCRPHTRRWENGQ